MSEISEVSNETSNVLHRENLAAKIVVYNWSISNVSLCFDFRKQKVCSPDFMLGNACCKLQFRIVRDVELAGSGALAINLFRVGQHVPDCTIKHKVSVFHEEGNPIVEEERQGSFHEQRTVYELVLFSKPTAEFRSLFNNSPLHIQCEFTLLSQVPNKCSDNVLNSETKERSAIFINKNNECSDSMLNTNSPATSTIRKNDHFFSKLFYENTNANYIKNDSPFIRSEPSIRPYLLFICMLILVLMAYRE